MVQSRRERLHQETLTEIKHLAYRQMAEEGTEAISLRAIARQMGMSSAAIYRYYENRDALITALFLDAYRDLAQTFETAIDAHPHASFAEHYRQRALAYRRWALEHQGEYQLIFGNPIPGYQVPTELVLPAARRCLQAFLEIFVKAWRAGAMRELPEYTRVQGELRASLDNWRTEAGYSDLPLSIFQLALVNWSTLHGLISLELFNHLQAIIGNSEPLYSAEIDAFLERLHMLVP